MAISLFDWVKLSFLITKASLFVESMGIELFIHISLFHAPKENSLFVGMKTKRISEIDTDQTFSALFFSRLQNLIMDIYNSSSDGID